MDFESESGDFSSEVGIAKMQKTKKFGRLWNIQFGGSIDQSPLVVDGKVYFGSFNHNLYCVNATDGDEIWKFKTGDRIGISSPVFSDGIIYIGSYDHHLYAIDANNGNLIWKHPARGEIIGSPTVHKDSVFFGSRDFNMYCVSRRNGSLKWKYATRAEIISEPNMVGNRIIFGSYDRNLYCLDSSNGTLLWKVETYDEVFNTGNYAVLDGHIFVSSMDNFLRKIEIDTGKVVWKKELGQYGANCGTVLSGSTILVPARDGILYAFDEEGKLLWRFTRSKPLGRPTVYGDSVYITCEDHNLYCLTLGGSIVWKFETRGMNWWKPTAWENMIFFGSYDCNLYAVSADEGKLIWKFKAQGSPSPYQEPHPGFEMKVGSQSEDSEKKEKRKVYDKEGSEEVRTASSTYRSENTYQSSSQYRRKGDYQDSFR